MRPENVLAMMNVLEKALQIYGQDVMILEDVLKQVKQRFEFAYRDYIDLCIYTMDI